jgi:segregation and condensation protein A
MAYEIKLDIFEGPLDLLLYLIRKNKIDIYNIPIAVITDQYLEYLEIMRSLNLDLAGEYLLLAATLVHIKSRMLLPVTEEIDSDEADDPRTELVQQLLEYELYKKAAVKLDRRLLLERDVFKSGYCFPDDQEDDNNDSEIELEIFDLVEAFQKIISKIYDEVVLEIDCEKLSLPDIINSIMKRLSNECPLAFVELIGELRNRSKIVYTFLAILELMKMGRIRAYQVDPFGTINISLVDTHKIISP